MDESNTAFENKDLSYVEDAHERSAWTKTSIGVAVKQVQELHACAHIPSIFMVYTEESIIGIGSGPLRYFCEDPVVIEKFKHYLHNIVDGVLEESAINSRENVNESEEIEKLLCDEGETDSCLTDVFENGGQIEEIVTSENIPPDVERNVTLHTKWTPLVITPPNNPDDATYLATTVCGGENPLKNDGQTKTNGGYVICDSWDEARCCIQEYELETGTKFATYIKKGKFNSDKIDISKHKIQFEDIKELGREQVIKYSGIPFVILGKKTFDCVYGVDRNISFKRRRFKHINQLRKLNGEHLYPKRKSNTKKVGCPASICVRDIVFFPNNAALKDTRWFRSEMSRNLREDFTKNSGEGVAVDRKFYVRFPCCDSHLWHENVPLPVSEELYD